MTTNLALSIIVISTLVIGEIAAFFSLPVAVVAHEVSEMIVIATAFVCYGHGAS